MASEDHSAQGGLGALDEGMMLEAQTHFKNVAELINHVSLWLTPDDVLTTTQINHKWRAAILWDGYEEDKDALKVWDGDLQEIEYSRDTFRPFGYWALCSGLLYLTMWVVVFGLVSTAGQDRKVFSDFVTTLITLGTILTVPAILLGLLFCVKGSLKCKVPVAFLMIVLFPINIGLLLWFSYGIDLKMVVEQSHVEAETSLPFEATGGTYECRSAMPGTLQISDPGNWKSPAGLVGETIKKSFFLDNGGTWKGATYSGLVLQYQGENGFPRASGSPWSSATAASQNSTSGGSTTTPLQNYQSMVFNSATTSKLRTKIYVYNPFPFPYRGSNASSPPTVDITVQRGDDTYSNVIVLLYQRNGPVTAFDSTATKPPSDFVPKVNIVAPGIDSIYKYGDWDVSYASGASTYATNVEKVPLNLVDVIRSGADVAKDNVPTSVLEEQMRGEDEYQIRDLCYTLFQQTYDASAMGLTATFSNWTSDSEAANTLVCFNSTDVSGSCQGVTSDGPTKVIPVSPALGSPTRAFSSSNSPCITPSLVILDLNANVLNSDGEFVSFYSLPANSVVYVHGESYWLQNLIDEKGSHIRKEPIFRYLFGRAYDPVPIFGVAVGPSLVSGGAQTHTVVPIVLFTILFVVYAIVLVFTYSRSNKIKQVFHAEQRMEEQKQRWRLRRKFPPHRLVKS